MLFHSTVFQHMYSLFCMKDNKRKWNIINLTVYNLLIEKLPSLEAGIAVLTLYFMNV